MIITKKVGDLRKAIEDIPDDREMFIIIEESGVSHTFAVHDMRKDIVRVELPSKHKEIKTTKPVAALVILHKLPN